MGLEWEYNEEEMQENFELIPFGEYEMIISEAEYKENKQGTGMLLALKCQIIDGDYENRIVFENLNIEHKNEIAAAIGRKKLNSLLLALDLSSIKEEKELEDIPFVGIVSIQKGTDGYEDRNVIKNFKPLKEKEIISSSSKKTEKKMSKKAPWDE